MFDVRDGERRALLFEGEIRDGPSQEQARLWNGASGEGDHDIRRIITAMFPWDRDIPRLTARLPDGQVLVADDPLGCIKATPLPGFLCKP